MKKLGQKSRDAVSLRRMEDQLFLFSSIYLEKTNFSSPKTAVLSQEKISIWSGGGGGDCVRVVEHQLQEICGNDAAKLSEVLMWA